MKAYKGEILLERRRQFLEVETVLSVSKFNGDFVGLISSNE